MNRRGDKILSVYWFAILAIVAVGIVAMVVIFYGKPYDVREAEAGLMINKIVDCLSDGKLLRQDIDNGNVLQECHFDFSEENEFYLEVENLGIKQGNFNLKDSCDLRTESIVCVKRNAYFFDEDGNEIIIKILGVVRKNE